MNKKIEHGQRRQTKLIVSRSVWVVVGPVLAVKMGKGEVMAVLSPPPPCSQCKWSLHAVPQHLIGCDEHNADDERHSEGADQAFPDARLPVLLLWMD